MAERLPIAVVIPTRNEEKNLPGCLQRLLKFSEIFIVDSGSTDRTKEIAVEFGAKFIEFRWDGKYPKKRNWFLLNFPLTQPWVLFLDADEYLDDDVCDAISKAILKDDVDGYWLRYRNFFMGRPLNHGIPQYKLSLFRVGSGYYEQINEDHWTPLDMEVHEHPIITGKVGRIRHAVDHHDYNGLSRFVDKHRHYAQWEARRYSLLVDGDRSHFTWRQHLKYASVSRAWFPPCYFIATYFLRLGFLDGGPGLQYALLKFWYFQLVRLFIQEELNDPF